MKFVMIQKWKKEYFKLESFLIFFITYINNSVNNIIYCLKILF